MGRQMNMSLVVAIVLSILLKEQCSAYMCYNCNDVASPVDCERSINCPAGERIWNMCQEDRFINVPCKPTHCFTDKYLNNNGHVRFNLGCKSDRVCNLLATLSGKREAEDIFGKRNIIHLCTQCCEKDYCNNAICTDTTTPAPNLQCYQCEDIEDLAACETLVACPEGNECFADIYYNDRGDVRHRLGCRLKSVCTRYMSLGTHVPHGKRQGFAQLCGGCCNTAHCNIAGCEGIEHLKDGHHYSSG